MRWSALPSRCVLGACVALLVGGAEATAAHVFPDRAALLAARDAWCANPTTAATTYGHISTWDVSAVTDLSFVFCVHSGGTAFVSTASCNTACSSFNDPIGGWNTSRATTMRGMFAYASAFNQPLAFDTSSVTDMKRMFQGASAFNQPLAFDTSSVTTMYGMFAWASTFNQPLAFFDTSSVTSMYAMFVDAFAFNQPLTFDTSSVSDWQNTFFGTTSLSDCNKALIHACFSSNSRWPYSWGGYAPCSPSLPPSPSPPGLSPLGPSPLPPPTTFYIRGSRSQLSFGPNDECTIEFAEGGTSLTSTCAINEPSGRRLQEDVTDRLAQLEAKTARLEAKTARLELDNAQLTAEIEALRGAAP